MSFEGDKLIVEMELDSKGLKKDFTIFKKEAKRASKKAGDDFDVFVNKRFGKGIFQLRSQILGIGAAIGAAFVGAFASREIIEASIRQEEAINNLNSSLKLAGQFSEAASLRIQEFAAEIEKTTTVGDEAALEMFTLARTFVRTNDEAQKLTKAAIELSAATGMSLDSAVKNLGKTFAGLTGELGEVLPALRNLSAEALKSGGALDFVINRFGGAATAKTETFQGAVTQLKNAWGSLLEAIGSYITRSPKIQSLINSLATVVQKFADNTKEAADEQFGTALQKSQIRAAKLQEELDGINKQLLKIREGKIVKTVFDDKFFSDKLLGRAAVLERQLQLIQQRIVRMSQDAPDPEKVVPLPDVNKFRAKLAELELARIAAEEADIKRGGVTVEERTRLIELGSQKQAALIMQTNEQIRQIEEQFAKDASLTQEQRNQLILEKQQELGFKLREVASTQQELAKSDLDLFKEGFEESFKTSAQTVKNFGAQIAGTIKGGIVGAFSALGAALAKGENGFDAFAKAVLGTFGELAIQIGTMMVFAGTGLSFIPGFQSSAGSVPFGLALIVLGGALKAMAGGEGPSGAGGSVGGAPTTGDDQDFDAGFDPEEISEQQAINVNIQGDVFDSDQTGIRIAEIINESFDTQGTLINAAATS